MVGANAGGGTDIVARLLAEKLAESMKGTFVVENKPGASNTIAADLTAKAPPDGHTILVATNTGQAIAPHLLKLGFDPMKDLIPIGLVVNVPNVLVVGASVPVNSVHVPYKGSAQAHLDIIGGNVEMMFDTTSSSMGQIKAGKFKPLAVTSDRRSSELPDVPTLAEAGLPGFDMTTWYAVYVTAGTPPDIVAKLQAELIRIVALPDVQAKLRGLGGEPGTMTVEQFTRFNAQEYERFGRLIREANIKPE